MIAAWIDYLATGAEINDPLEDEVRLALALEGSERTAGLLRLIDRGLGADAAVHHRIHALLRSFDQD
ncbi:hypothetical protein [Sinomonas humi]|uniref:hypothetical protein n=1 Tax=Sinomonas humi TaxID=1338436 RepID=UPI00068EC2A5